MTTEYERLELNCDVIQSVADTLFNNPETPAHVYMGVRAARQWLNMGPHSFTADPDCDLLTALHAREALVDGAIKRTDPTTVAESHEIRRAVNFIQDQNKWAMVRVSQDDSTQWSYFQNLEHAKAGRRTRTRPARLLGKYRDDATANADIANLWRLCIQPPVVKMISNDPDGVVHVYRNGPNSCMSHGLGSYDTDVHPTYVYGTEDIGLLYAEKGDRIVARVLLNLKRKEFTTIYGNRSSLMDWLEQNEYTGGSLDGCRLLRVETCNGDLTLPYIDGYPNTVTEHTSKYLKIESGGEWTAESVDGVASECRGERCCHCENRIDTDWDGGQYLDSADGFVCEDCLGQRYILAYTGRYDQEWIDPEYDTVYEYGYESYTEYGLEYHDLVLVDDGTVYHRDDVVELYDGTLVHSDDAYYCEECEQHYPAHKMTEHDDRAVCDDCHEEITAREAA